MLLQRFVFPKPPRRVISEQLDNEQEAKPKEKTIFNVKIESYDPAAKAKIIREVKATVANLNLMEVSVPS